MAKRKSTDPFAGRWRITSMSEWDADFIDAEVEAYIRFVKGGSGEFQFGHVQCQLDYELTERSGRPAAEFSFEGMDEMDPTTGRGWTVRDGDQLRGRLAFHAGDRSDFLAMRIGKRLQ